MWRSRRKALLLSTEGRCAPHGVLGYQFSSLQFPYIHSKQQEHCFLKSSILKRLVDFFRLFFFFPLDIFYQFIQNMFSQIPFSLEKVPSNVCRTLHCETNCIVHSVSLQGCVQHSIHVTALDSLQMCALWMGCGLSDFGSLDLLSRLLPQHLTSFEEIFIHMPKYRCILSVALSSIFTSQLSQQWI